MMPARVPTRKNNRKKIRPDSPALETGPAGDAARDVKGGSHGMPESSATMPKSSATMPESSATMPESSARFGMDHEPSQVMWFLD